MIKSRERHVADLAAMRERQNKAAIQAAAERAAARAAERAAKKAKRDARTPTRIDRQIDQFRVSQERTERVEKMLAVVRRTKTQPNIEPRSIMRSTLDVGTFKGAA